MFAAGVTFRSLRRGLVLDEGWCFEGADIVGPYEVGGC